MANALQAVLDRAKEKAPEKAPKLERAAAPPRPRQEARARPEELAERPAREGASKSFRPVREGKRFVGAHFHPEVARQLKMLAAEDGTTIQELLEQAVDLLFVKSGKAKIGDLVRKGRGV